MAQRVNYGSVGDGQCSYHKQIYILTLSDNRVT